MPAISAGARARRRRRSDAPLRTGASRGWLAWLAAVLALCVLAGVQYHLIVHRLPYETFYSGDCGIKLLQTQSLVANRWHSLALIYPGEQLDPDHRFVETGGLVVRKGRVFGSHSQAFAIVSSFPYAWLGYAGLYLVPALSLLGAAFLLWLFAKRWYGPWRALLAMVVMAGCTPLLFYGLEFWEHSLAVCIMLAAIALVVTPGFAASPRRLVVAGALLAVAFAVRPEAACLRSRTAWPVKTNWFDAAS